MRSFEIARISERCRRGLAASTAPKWRRAELLAMVDDHARDMLRRSLRAAFQRGESLLGRATPVTPAAERNSPLPGSTCAHVCGSAPDHRCEHRSITHIEFTNPAGGRTRLPLCAPCHRSETAAIEAEHAH